MARVIATDAQGELSQNGSLSNPLFASAKVGDVGAITIKTDEAGAVRPGYTLPGVPNLAFSLDNVTYGSAGVSISLGDISYTGTAVYVKCMAESGSLVSIALPQDGIVTSSNASATADVLTVTTFAPDVSVDVAGNVSFAATAINVPVACPVHTATVYTEESDTFSNSTISALFGTKTEGGGSVVESTELRCLTTTGNDLATMYRATALDNDFEIQLTSYCVSNGLGAATVLSVHQSTTAPSARTDWAAASINAALLFVANIYLVTGTTWALRLMHYNADGTLHVYDNVSNTWVTSGWTDIPLGSSSQSPSVSVKAKRVGSTWTVSVGGYVTKATIPTFTARTLTGSYYACWGDINDNDRFADQRFTAYRYTPTPPLV